MRKLKPHRRFIVGALLCAALVTWPLAAVRTLGDDAGTASVARGALNNLLSNFSSQSANASASIDTRDLTDAAYLTLLEHQNSATAEGYLGRVLDTQEMNAQSPLYGAIKWRTGDATVTDPNAVEFSAQALGPILSGFAGQLAPQFRARLSSRVPAFISAIKKHDVPVTYTNIYLMKTVNLLLLGQYAHDQTTISEARAQLTAWITFTRANGIGEFDSPTYYATDLDTLSSGYRYVTDEQDRHTLGTILDYFWTDIAANYFPAGHRLSGPFSRDYDFVSGYGDLKDWIASAGWDSTQSVGTLKNLQGTFLYNNLQPGGYPIPPSAKDLAFKTPRDVMSTWDAVPTHIRWNRVAGGVSIGCADGSYGPQDKMFDITFPGAPTFPQVSVVVDSHNAPYGLGTELTKAEHVSAQIACAGHGANALVTLNIDPSQLPAGAVSLDTDVLLPLQASLALNGSSISPSVNSSVPVHVNDIVSAGYGKGAVAVRLLHADAIDGTAPAISVVTDSVGTSRGVAWIRIAHLGSGQHTSQRNVHIAFLFQARDDGSTSGAVSDLKKTVVTDSSNGGNWDIKVQAPQGALEVERSSTNRGVIVRELADGQPMQRMPLGVDGANLSSTIWSGL